MRHCVHDLCGIFTVFWTFWVAAPELSGWFSCTPRIPRWSRSLEWSWSLRPASTRIAPAGHLGLAGCSFLMYCASPRTSPCLGRSPLVRFACRWLCSYLACRWLCSFACCWLCSSRFFSSLLQIFVFFSLSSYFRGFASFFSPQAHWLWFRLGFSPLAPWLWFLLCFFLTTGSLAVVPSVLLVSTPWLVSGFPPTSLLSLAPFVIDGSRWVPSVHGKVVYNNVFCCMWGLGLRVSLLLLLVGVLQCHCVMLWTVSTFTMKAFIAASCHCVVVWFVRHRWAYRSSCLFLSSGSNWKSLSLSHATSL